MLRHIWKVLTSFNVSPVDFVLTAERVKLKVWRLGFRGLTSLLATYICPCSDKKKTLCLNFDLSCGACDLTYLT